MEEASSNIFDTNLSMASIQLNFFDGLNILIASFIIGLYIRFLYSRFSITYSSRASFGNTLLILTISVASLIAVVKTSLALSLGLVGALSVIRFRTAIKEPYNLSIMLFAICSAISIGASQFIFTLQIMFFGTFAIIYAYRSYRSNNKKSTNAKVDDIDTIALEFPSGTTLAKIFNILSEETQYYSILTMDQSDNKSISLVVNVKIENQESLSHLKDNIFKECPGASFSFYNTPSV